MSTTKYLHQEKICTSDGEIARPQAEHCDLGLVEFDNTEDMRKAPAATEALRNNNHPNQQI